MEDALDNKTLSAEQDRRIFEAIDQEQRRLRNFIRKRVRDDEEILQDVFYELDQWPFEKVVLKHFHLEIF